MPRCICLMRWTQQGIAKVKNSGARLDAGRKAFKELGVEIKDVHMTMGRYDLVAVLEGPTDDAIARALLSLASQGNIQTETMKAWNEDEYRKITGSV
ncbi:MAG: GYD domain-containing protein [Pyrinomonadaceae bacterium]